MQMITDAVGRCRQILKELVENSRKTEMKPESFRWAIDTIKVAINELGRSVLESVIAAAEVAEDVVEQGNSLYRFKQVVPKIWLTSVASVSKVSFFGRANL